MSRQRAKDDQLKADGHTRLGTVWLTPAATAALAKLAPAGTSKASVVCAALVAAAEGGPRLAARDDLRDGKRNAGDALRALAQRSACTKPTNMESS